MPDERLQDAYTQAESVVFLSEGVPFMLAGEEFMRSKYNPDTGKYEGNSYNVGDYVNAMDYSLKAKHLDVFEKFRELIALRREYGAFRISDRAQIDERLSLLGFDGGNISFALDDLIVVHSLLGTDIELDGSYELVYSNLRAAGGTYTGAFDVRGNESVVLRKVA